MPISLACHCGRQLRLKDEAAGKHIRCPECGNLLRVPIQTDEAAEEPSPDDFLRALSQSGDLPTAPSPPTQQPTERSAEQATTEPPREFAPPSHHSKQSDQAGSPPEPPFPDVPLPDDGLPPPLSFSTTDRLNRHDRTARGAVLILRIFAWLGLAAALVYVLITVAGILLVSAAAKPDVRPAATAVTGIFGFGFILATLVSAAFWWALLIAAASFTENLIEIRLNTQRLQTRSPRR